MKNINCDKLLVRLQNLFDEWKKEAGFNATFKELDEIFFIEDYILASGFVSSKVNRMICGRIVDTYNNWIGRIHSWLVPTPYSLISTSESHLFNEAEKEELKMILKELMAFVSQNAVVGLTKDSKMEAGFVDKSLSLWKKHLQTLVKYSSKVHEYWKREASNE